MAAKVFISYRRDDSKYQARMIHAAFCRVIPSDHVFMDVDTIRPGENFRQVIQGWVNQCEVLLALIGPEWIDASDPKTKRRRLDNPSDFVRVEIGEALVRRIPVVPVLLDDTQMPDVSLLPDELKELVERQAEFVEYRTFDTDVERLIERLGFAAPSPPHRTIHGKANKSDARAKSPNEHGPRHNLAERYQQGIVLRRESPRKSHSDFGPRDPVRILAAGDRARVPELVPVRYERMLTSPFAFFRGAAAVMAQDLKNEPSAGIAVQACGDCHLMNFGAFTTPEGRILFDINDFGETLPGVDFTVDLKRLAASVVLVALAEKLSTKRARAAAAATVAAYRLRMAALAKLSPLQIRQSRIDLVQEVSQFQDRKLRKRIKAVVIKKGAKAAKRDANFPQIVEGGARITDRPPVIYHLEPKVAARDHFAAEKVFASYKKSLPPDSLRVFEQYTLRDTAFMAVGVGSVGTFCVICLFTSKDGAPLLLLFKEAGTSVLECLGRKFEGHPGQRVADGQRILQATRDIFLGWADDAVSGRHFYVRHLKNRLGLLSEIIKENALEEYARLCANVLACAHAHSADPAVIAGYMGEDDALDSALSSFAMVYAARTQGDYDFLKRRFRPS
jgi:uncharacterized protein (DUF2252 family)